MTRSSAQATRLAAARRPDTTELPSHAAGQFATSLIVLLALMLGGAGDWLLRIPDHTEAVLTALIVIVCCAGIAWSVAGRLRPLLCLFYVFNLCWLGLASIYQLSHGLAAWGDSGITADSQDATTALALNLLALTAFLLGYAVKSRRVIGGAAEHVATLAPHVRGRRQRLALSLLVVATALLPLVLATSGGIGTLFSSRSQLNIALASAGVGQAGGTGVALVKLIPGATALSSALLLLSIIQSDRRSPDDVARPLPPWLMLGWAIVLVACFANPLVYTRYIALGAFGSIGFLLIRPRSRRAGVALVAIGVATMLFVYPAAGVFSSGIGSVPAGTSSFSPQELATKDFDGFQQFVNTVIFVHDEGHSDGRYAASALLIFVPRAWWSGKAVPASIDVASHRNYRFTNLSLPVQAEFYLDFGPAGMAVLMLLWGLLWSWLDMQWAQRSRWTVLIAYLAMAQIGFIRGPLGAEAPVFGLTTLLLILGTRRVLESDQRHGSIRAASPPLRTLPTGRVRPRVRP